MATSAVRRLLVELQHVQNEFARLYGVTDIFSNSKIFEILIADHLGLELIPGHSGSCDAKDELGRDVEIKHFKESSSNHSWTFNDFSDNTIEKLQSKVASVVFAHVDDGASPPIVDWFYRVPGENVGRYLADATTRIRNMRKMINVSPRQIECLMHFERTEDGSDWHPYRDLLAKVFLVIKRLELESDVSNLLTSSKLWELVVAIELGHKVNSEQGGRAGAFDAEDLQGNLYEYKVSSTRAWNFQDISDQVLTKYREREHFVLAVVDKPGLKTTEIHLVEPDRLVPHLKRKLEARKAKLKNKGLSLRRNQVSLSAGELKLVGANKVFSD